MKPLSRFLVFVLTISLLYPLPSLASDEFNPDFILSDEELQDWQTMTRADIQAFLDDQGGAISDMRFEDVDGTTRVTADIIYQAAKEHEINPKYLLVKLQKEQSLVTEDDPTQKQLDGATGYGITDGCGWSCDTYLNNKGFGKQVDSAAGIMRWYYENVGIQGFIKQPNTNYFIDGTPVRPLSYATAFLYTYTPHIQGNENFWILWQDWFEQVYPNGSLVTTGESADVYLIQNGERRLIESMTALVTRFDPDMIIEISESELARYDIGAPISLPNYSILYDGDLYYLLDYDTLRPFESEAAVRAIGYHPDETIEVEKSDIAQYNLGRTITAETNEPVGTLVRAEESDQLYLIKDGEYRPIFDEAIGTVNFPAVDPELVSVAILSDLDEGEPLLFKDGTLFGIEGSNKIYVAENGKKRHIATEEVFTGLGYKWENIVWVNDFAGIAHDTGQPLYLNRTVLDTDTVPELIVLDTDEDTSTVSEPVDVMQRTPADETTYVGAEFATDVDAYIVANAETGEIYAGKNIDVVRPIASFTKVMTAYQLMEENLNLRHITEYTSADHKAQYHRFRIVDGEMVRNEDLMDALLVSSLNTPARMLVDSVDEDETAFLTRMNDQAAAWGLDETTFVDPAGTGLGNVSTAREYMALFQKASLDSTVRAYMGKDSYEYDEILDIDDKPRHYDDHSNDLANQSNLGFTIIASKTGYLDESGAGLAMLVERPSDGEQFIVITMGNPDYSNRFDAPEALTEWALDRY